MAALSTTSGVSVPTIKYYLREGPLEPETLTGPNQADCRDDHVHRLRLIRALMDVGGLGVGAVRAVLAAIADPELSLHDLLGVAHQALGPPPDRQPVPRRRGARPRRDGRLLGGSRPGDRREPSCSPTLGRRAGALRA